MNDLKHFYHFKKILSKLFLKKTKSILRLVVLLIFLALNLEITEDQRMASNAPKNT